MDYYGIGDFVEGGWGVGGCWGLGYLFGIGFFCINVNRNGILSIV